VVFTGKNGSGKSNILEAISYLSTLRSFRRAPVRDMVTIGKEQFFLNASIENRNRTQDISVIESISGARQLFINRNLCRQVSDFLFEYRCVCFSPGDFAIGSGASGVRRRFVDQLISSNDRNYLLLLSGYVRALTQRNRAAKAKNEMAMRAFEMVMAENAPGIIAARRQTIFQLETQIRSLLAGKYDFSIRYKPDFDGGTEDFLRRFSSMRRREIQRGCTLTGVQLDDIELILNGKSLRTFGSTGQIRMVTLLMRLAEYTLLRRTPAPVMVLADDVTGELDDANRELFFRTVSTSDMRFHTYAVLPGDGLLRDAQFIKL
jgi:DNA replication and repair protein RecF